MNQSKVGAFIAEKRKEHGMTQKQLAEKLGITDRAVSDKNINSKMMNSEHFRWMVLNFGCKPVNL